MPTVRLQEIKFVVSENYHEPQFPAFLLNVVKNPLALGSTNSRLQLGNVIGAHYQELSLSGLCTIRITQYQALVGNVMTAILVRHCPTVTAAVLDCPPRHHDRALPSPGMLSPVFMVLYLGTLFFRLSFSFD